MSNTPTNIKANQILIERAPRPHYLLDGGIFVKGRESSTKMRILLVNQPYKRKFHIVWPVVGLLYV